MRETVPPPTAAPPARQRLITLPYLLAVAGVHFYFVSYSMSLVEVPRALEGEPSWVVGYVVGALGIAGMLSRPLVGVWVDAGHRQLWLRLGAIATVAAFVGYALVPGPWSMSGFRMLHGVAMGLYTTALLAIVASGLPDDRRGLGVGIYQSANAAATLYGGFLAGLLIDRVGFEPAFLTSAAAAGLALVFGGLAGDPGEARRREDRAALGPVRRRWISRTALVPATVFFTMTTTMGAIGAFLPLFALERDLGNVGLFYTAFAAAQLGTRASAGWLSDRFGRSAVVMPGLVLGATAMLLLSMVSTPAALLGVALLYGVALAAVQTSIVALIVDRTPPVQLGSAMATYTIAWDVGAVVGSVMLGVVAGATSYAAVFAMAALFPLAGLVLFATKVRGPHPVARAA